MPILSENVLLFFKTQNMHFWKKYALGGLNTHMPLLLLLPLKPQSCISVVKIVKQGIICVKEEREAAGGLTRKKKL